jgi:hypothetical protein
MTIPLNETTARAATIERIARLERYARIGQNLTTEVVRGPILNRVVRRLAHIDQLIAKHKDHIGRPGSYDCDYLNV